MVVKVSIRDYWVNPKGVDIANYWQNLKVDKPLDTNTIEKPLRIKYSQDKEEKK